MPTCNSCLHWRPAGPAGEGLCRRHAPQPLVFLRYSDSAIPPAAPHWPTTAADDSCGDHQPRPLRPDDPALVRAERAEAFKVWVHTYLDQHDVPHHPPGTHGAEGCRIGDRLDWLFAQLTRRAESGGAQ